VVSGSFSLAEASVEFVLSGLGGLVVGLAVGRVIREVRRRLNDPPIEITISLLSGYAAYLPAEELGLSGVIAAVTVGVYMGWHTPELTTAVMRIQTTAVWEILMFLLNAVLFLLVGLQLPTVLDSISGHTAGELLLWSVLVSLVVIGVRLAWQFTVVYLIRAIDRRAVVRARRSTVGQRLVVGWAGMRGAVSLAAALALPLETDAGGAFPERDLLIFLAFAVILATLVGQGLTLGPLIERLGLRGDDGEHEEEVQARLETAAAALSRIDELSGEDWVRNDTAERVSGLYRYRLRRFGAQADGEGEPYEERTDAYRRLMYELFDAQREALLALRNQGTIGDEVRRRIERELDLEESRIEP
jgi:CPA1 family monovalent cation:H+ antiporter